MFLELLGFLSSLDTGFNVLSYLTVRAVFAMMTALLITLFLGKWIIAKLQQYQIGQVIREDGPETHLEKKGCLLYTSPSPRDATLSRMPSSA